MFFRITQTLVRVEQHVEHSQIDQYISTTECRLLVKYKYNKIQQKFHQIQNLSIAQIILIHARELTLFKYKV